jgi:hypothetical protein
MAETKTRARRGQYRHRTNAVHITLYTSQGVPLTPEAKSSAVAEVEKIARLYGLLVNVAVT